LFSLLLTAEKGCMSIAGLPAIFFPFQCSLFTFFKSFPQMFLRAAYMRKNLVGVLF